MPATLTLVPGSLRVDNATVSNESDFFGTGRNLGNLSPNTARILTYEATVAGSGSFSGSTTIVNTANVRSDEVTTKQDDANVVVNLAAGTSFALRKTAFNLTQGVDATTVAANPGDIIVYTLNYRNTGGGTIAGAVIEDSIHDVLELSQITNQGGATSVNSVIRYPPVDVPAGVEVSRTFQVRVMPANLFPASSDLAMTNIYGNEVRVTVRRPTVAGAVTVVSQLSPPRTGPGDWLMLSLASITTTGYWLYRRKKPANI